MREHFVMPRPRVSLCRTAEFDPAARRGRDWLGNYQSSGVGLLTPGQKEIFEWIFLFGEERVGRTLEEHKFDSKMAKLYFYYSSMNAGKSTTLLQSSFNYRERGMNTVIFTPDVDDRYGVGEIVSRIGLQAGARSFSDSDNLITIVTEALQHKRIHCVLVDEAHFVKKHHVFEMGEIADKLGIPVLAYGLRTDFRGELFEGSQYLLAWADNLIELKSICQCGAKATMVIRIDEDGKTVKEGAQIEVGGNDRYISMCRKCYREKFYGD